MAFNSNGSVSEGMSAGGSRSRSDVVMDPYESAEEEEEKPMDKIENEDNQGIAM